MAKRKLKTTAWQPEANDAINLAAIRWFALTIEAKAIEIYGTDPRSIKRLERVLRRAVDNLQRIPTPRPIVADDNCPPGWVRCGEDCAPMCLME